LEIDCFEQQYDVPRDLFMILGGCREIFRVLRRVSLTAVIVANVIVVFLILFSDLLLLLEHRLLDRRGLQSVRLLLLLGDWFESSAAVSCWFFSKNGWHMLLHSLILI
jgi:hypothetical protein